MAGAERTSLTVEMGPQLRARLDELKEMLENLGGGNVVRYARAIDWLLQAYATQREGGNLYDAATVFGGWLTNFGTDGTPLEAMFADDYSRFVELAERFVRQATGKDLHFKPRIADAVGPGGLGDAPRS